MFLYLFSKLITIKTDNLYNELIENYLDGENYLFSLMNSFYIFIFLVSLFIYVSKTQCCKILGKFNIFFKIINRNNEILMIIIIGLIYNSMLSLVYLRYFYKDFNFKEQKIKESLLFISIIYNKLFIFSINFYCIDIYNKNKGNEIIFSQSMLITIYLLIIDGIIWIINHYANDDLLFYIQLRFSWIIGTLLFWFIIINIVLTFLKFSYFYVGGNFFCNFCCCNKNSVCRCCYSECCDNHCSYCHCCY